jgi:predicted MFS family arabinose efflux permease
MAAAVFHTGAVTWRQYYALLVIPAAVIFGLLLFYLKRPGKPAQPTATSTQRPTEQVKARWGPFLFLVLIGTITGFTYAAFTHFLPRYLDDAGMRPDGLSPESYRNYLAALVLLFAAVGQGVAGKIARPGRLEPLLAMVLFGIVPPLVWMSLAQGQARLWAACLMSLILFMNQPVYNSLIAEYVPRARRSLCYGFNNTLCFGIGGFGPACVGFMKDDRWRYGCLALVAAITGVLAIVLVCWQRSALARQRRDGSSVTSRD